MSTKIIIFTFEGQCTICVTCNKIKTTDKNLFIAVQKCTRTSCRPKNLAKITKILFKCLCPLKG